MIIDGVGGGPYDDLVSLRTAMYELMLHIGRRTDMRMRPSVATDMSLLPPCHSTKNDWMNSAGHMKKCSLANGFGWLYTKLRQRLKSCSALVVDDVAPRRLAPLTNAAD